MVMFVLAYLMSVKHNYWAEHSSFSDVWTVCRQAKPNPVHFPMPSHILQFEGVHKVRHAREEGVREGVADCDRGEVKRSEIESV